MVKQFLELVKKVFANVSFEISVDAEITIQQPEYLYSTTLEAWYHWSEVKPLDTTSRGIYAAITCDGFVILAHECAWEDGTPVAETPNTSIFGDTYSYSPLAYAVGW